MAIDRPSQLGAPESALKPAPPVRPDLPPIRTAVAVAPPLIVATAVEPEDGGHSESASEPPRPPWWRQSLAAVGSAIHWLFGFASLLCALSVLAAIPLAQFLTLGYFLEASRRVAMSGRLAAGFPGVRKAAVVGGLALGVWLAQAPVAIISDLWYSAELIAPESLIATRWRLFLLVSTLLMLAHVVSCLFAGARLRYFFWPVLLPVHLMRRLIWGVPLKQSIPPLKLWIAVVQGGWYVAARDAVWDFAVSLRLPYLFWLGVRGFLGGLAWLLIPVSLLAAGAGEEPGAATVTGLVGAVWLMVVCQYLPGLMTHFAVEQRMSAFLQVGKVHGQFRRTPLTFMFTVTLVLALAIPLYLFKIFFIPQEIGWLPSLLFVALTFPARLIQGAAYARGANTERRSWFVVRQAARLTLLPIAGFYVLFVFLSQYVAYFGVVSMFGQHAFLMPAPDFGFLQ